ncbi:MAG: DUF47 domain-containing protein [Burkholderia sp.]|nr:DUF47 domain-containing protein [Burkholderia sp.]
MFSRFMPNEVKFFDIFNKHVKYIIDASHELELMMGDLANAEIYKNRIQTAEKSADRIAHEAINLLHKTFVTPIDRDDIHRLISTMDDVLDLMEDTATALSLYDVRSVTSEASKLAHIVMQAVQQMQKAVFMLADMKYANQIFEVCKEIDRYESDADRVLNTAMSKLFREEGDVKTLIKLKAIYELLEDITDKCEDVANIIEGIVMENA